MTGKASRDKGARGELDVCNRLTKELGEELGVRYTRNLKQYQQTQEGDIEQLVGPYCVEVKNCASHDKIKAWWRQACGAARKRNALPCLAIKTSPGRWVFWVPHDRAIASGAAWAWEFQWASPLSFDLFCLTVREQMQ